MAALLLFGVVDDREGLPCRVLAVNDAGRWSSETAMIGGRIGWQATGNRAGETKVHTAKAGFGLMIETVNRKETMRIEDSKPSIQR